MTEITVTKNDISQASSRGTWEEKKAGLTGAYTIGLAIYAVAEAILVLASAVRSRSQPQSEIKL